MLGSLYGPCLLEQSQSQPSLEVDAVQAHSLSLFSLSFCFKIKNNQSMLDDTYPSHIRAPTIPLSP